MAARVVRGFFIFAAASFLLVSLPLDISATQTALVPLADSYVASDQPDTNNGQSAVLRIHKFELESAGVTHIQNTWLKFNLSTIAPQARIISMTLRMHTSNTTSGFVNRVGVFASENDSWTESEITWNNAPMIGSTQSPDTLDVALANRDYDFNITSIAEDKPVVTLVLKALKSTNLAGDVVFDSKEGGMSSPPLLIVDYETSSQPLDLMFLALIAVLVTGSLLTALIGYRHRRKPQNRKAEKVPRPYA